MSRRRVVVLASAATIFVLGGLVALGFVMMTRTDFGRERIRAFAESAINARIKGKMHIGKLGGSILGDLTIDSLNLRETNDSLFIATGLIHVRFNARDLFDRRIYATRLEITRPLVQLRQDSTGVWNYRRIFPSGPKALPKPPTAQQSFGDHVLVDSASISALTFRLSMPWHPDDSLHGTKRDSAIKYALSRKDKIIRRYGSSFAHTWEWTNGRIEIARARVDDRDPDGRWFEISRLDVDEHDPPFQFRNVRGRVRMDADSMWLSLPHFDLPASTGKASGKVWWGSGNPTHYDLAIVGDSVSLADVNWVYPTLPKTGGGTLKLRIHNERELQILNFVLSDMDVRTMRSHLTGKMTFATGAPVLLVKDLDVRTDPLDFAFIHQLNGKPLPYPWRGTITGTLKGPGGPVNRFRIDDANFVFRDANVPGAIARARARGELDVLYPALAVFRGFQLNLGEFDLRTIQFLNPTFPRFDGIVSGVATLDSSWLDLRFKNADVTHRDGPGVPNHFTGSGRVTFGDRFLTYDMALTAAPISLGTIAHAYREVPIPFRGEFSGPIRLQGTLEDLDVGAELRGAAGMVAYDGRVDADSVDGYGGQGTLRFADLDLRTLFDTVAMPVTSLNGEAGIALKGDSLATLVGGLTVDLQRSLVDSVRLFEGRARMRFAERRLLLDTLHVESVAGTLAAQGGLGLSPERRDSVRLVFSADSLGAFRRMRLSAAMGDSLLQRAAMADSMSGRVTATGALAGSIDSLDLRFKLVADLVDVAGQTAHAASVEGDLRDLTAKPHGTVTMSGDSLRLGGIGLTILSSKLEVKSDSLLAFTAEATSRNGPVVSTEGDLRFAADTTDVLFRALTVGFGDHSWKLERPARVVSSRSGVSLDTISMSGGASGRLVLGGQVPKDSSMQLTMRTEALSLADIGTLAQTEVALGAGTIDARLDVTGTRSSPVMQLSGELKEGKFGNISVQHIGIEGAYRDRQARATLDLTRDDVKVLQVSAFVPMDLRFQSMAKRVLDDTMHIGLISRDVDLKILEGFVATLSNATGKLNADLTLHGRPDQVTMDGFFHITDGAASIEALGGSRLRNLNVDIDAANDTLIVRRFSVVSGDEAADSLWIGGRVALPGADSLTQVQLSLGARHFRFAQPKVANIEISSSLRLTGPTRGLELTGSVTIDRGIIFIPELVDKDVIQLDDPEFASLIDTTIFANRSLLPKAPNALMQNLTVRNAIVAIGPDVRIQSAEANIKLGGELEITVGRNPRRPTAAPELALLGRLRTERGTYILDMGPGVKRLFSVENGELRFLGDPDLNPSLDINALYVVRQSTQGVGGRNDVRIRVKLQGTFQQPRLSFESADSLSLSESDMISYLVTGGPSYEISGIASSSGFGTTASRFASSWFASVLSQRLSGGLFDYVEVSRANNALLPSQGAGLANSVFSGVQLGFGRQISDRTWVTLQAGLCRGQGQGQGLPNINSFGAKLERILAGGYGFSLSADPSTKDLFCGSEGFAPTPRQYGLDFYRAWRF